MVPGTARGQNRVIVLFGWTKNKSTERYADRKNQLNSLVLFILLVNSSSFYNPSIANSFAGKKSSPVSRYLMLTLSPACK